MHLFYYLFIIEVAIAIVVLTNVAEYIFMPVKERTLRYISDERLNVYLLLSLGAIFIFHAFKNPLTLDDIPCYVDAFYESDNVSWTRVLSLGYESLKTETGFALVIKAVSSLFCSDQVLFILTSAFILLAVYFSVRQYSPMSWVSVFVFMTESFPQSLFILRAFLFSGIAFSIHMSSVIFIPVYFLYGLKNWRYLLLLLLFLTVFLVASFNTLLPWFVEYVIPEYAYYIINADNYEGASWKMPALLSSILLFRVIVMKEHFFEDGINRLLSITMILAVIVYTAGMGFGFGLTSRVAMSFTNMTFLILPNTLQYIKSSSWQFACAIVYILFNSFFFFKSTSDVLWASYQLLEILIFFYCIICISHFILKEYGCYYFRVRYWLL